MASLEGARGLTEDEARGELARIAGPAMALIERFIFMLATANGTQNLVSKGSLPRIWERHILDSIQLVSLARDEDRHWGDIGTGAGFPGLLIAMLDRFEMVLIEPRRRRVEFLNSCIDVLGLRNVRVEAKSARDVKGCKFDVVSARAVASTGDLLSMSGHFAKPSTRFIFPKGERAASDVESARLGWHGMFHVEQSRTHPDSGIIVIDQVRPK